MSWLDDLYKASTGRLWFAFFGIGHHMEAWICTSPHIFVGYVGSSGDWVGPDRVSPHLHVRLRLWNKGGPDVTVISWTIPQLTKKYDGDEPKGTLTLEKSGKPLLLEWKLHPQQQPIEVQVGDTLTVKLNLSNDLPKQFSATVTEQS